ncbi:uncharacterized protein LOC122655849 [Telopea speciosissima]|uniref:uncharacterized protein LOC122655849 n=1 Tax=Telopea speciosissima TaxID=54955 RepID=UPI001CC53470|nr:uncharacterized protein LOC122655849 [Telopea speciosissima]
MRVKGNDCSIPELISFLKTAFRSTDFEELEQKLMLREQKLKLDKEALEDKLKDAMKREVELVAELKAHRTRCRELETIRNADKSKWALSMELETVKKECISLKYKLSGLEFDKHGIEEELNKYKILCDKLKEKFICLQEDYIVVCEREKRAQGRISTLSEELKKMKDETREKYVQLKVQNRDLVCGKKRAEDELETWKKMFLGLESRVIMLEKDTLVLTNNDPRFILRLEAESRGSVGTISNEDKEKKEASFVTKIQEEANGEGDGDGDGASYKTLNCDAGTNIPENVGSSCCSRDEESRNVQVTGPPCIRIPHELLVNVKEEKDNVSLETNLQDGRRVRRQLESGQEGSTNKKMAGSKPGIGRSMDVIEIDSDDETSEMNIVAVATSNIRDKGKTPVSVDNSFKGVLKDEKEMAPENCLKRINSSQRGEEHKSICNITSDSEDENDEDKIPIRKLKMKRLQDLTHESMGVPLNQCSMAPILSFGDCNAEESFTPSRRHLVTLVQCEERKGGLGRTSPGYLVGNASDTEYQIEGPAAENVQDHEGKDVASDAKGGASLDRFIVDGSDGSDDEDSSTDSKEDCELVLSMIRRNKKNKSEWTFEADMLSSFQKDPVLCMKAVCALYKKQTVEEKYIMGSLYLNNWGFSNIDAFRGTYLAKFLMDGASRGALKKTVEELEKHMPGGLDECRRLANQYYKQLFKIYQNKEDPFFP